MSTRRRHSMETKLKVVKEVLETGNASLVARRYDLSSSMVSKWVRKYKQYGDTAFNESSKRNGELIEYTNKNHRKLENENERLKKILGEKELEVAILRDLLKK